MIYKNRSEKENIIFTFIKYKRLGLASPRLSAFDVCDRIRGVTRDRKESCDLLAVHDTIRILKIIGKTDVLRAVKAVYFFNLGQRIRKNDITNRVLRHAYETNCDERTVYRQLEYARKVYKTVRENMW